MKYIQGVDRNQTAIFPTTMEMAIEEDNEVRFIDIFIESLPLKKMGFADVEVQTQASKQEGGRPSYHPKDLLKLYIYGYMNSIRSSRKL